MFYIDITMSVYNIILLYIIVVLKPNSCHILFRLLNLSVNYMASFELVAHSCPNTDSLELTELTVDECAKACVTSTEMYCRGFGYRINDLPNGYFLTCYLLRVNPKSVNGTVPTPDPTCTTFSSTFFFVLFLHCIAIN